MSEDQARDEAKDAESIQRVIEKSQQAIADADRDTK